MFLLKGILPLCALFSIIVCHKSASVSAAVVPEQIAIAATGIFETPIIVTWVTFSPTNTSQVQYWLHGDVSTNKTALGYSRTFVDNGKAKTVRYIHRVKIATTLPTQTYDYRCGSAEGWSDVMSLRTLGSDESFSPTFAVYGDFGLENARSLPYLKKDVTEGRIDAVLHCGDIAYNLHENDGKSGDDFMNQIQPIASSIPYMVAPGNHEFINNFTHYKARFSMPGNKDSLYYSWDVGPVHIISIDSEVYFFLWDGLSLIGEQFHWLEEDLKLATRPDQRAKRPWIITMFHHPMYCTTVNGQDCNHHESLARVGLPLEHKYGMERLFYDYGVDIVLTGHEHIYERYWPIYDFHVKNGSSEEPYTDPGAPVHVVTGAAGCREEHKGDGFQRDQPDWVAVTNSNYSYTKMTVHNFTHVTLKQISIDLGGDVIDEITVIKHKHGPYH